MTKRLSISCPDELYQLLKGLADLQGLPVSRLVVDMLVLASPAMRDTYNLMVMAQNSLASLGALDGDLGVKNQRLALLDAIDDLRAKVAASTPI